MTINYLGTLRREFHHVRTNRDEDDGHGYEPAMFLMNYNKPGRSFIIPLGAFWKYIEPLDNLDVYPSDIQEFKIITEKALRDLRTAKSLPREMGAKLRIQATDDLHACAFASALWTSNKILPSVGWNLYKTMMMFDIEPSPQSAAQLILFIQDGLQDLKNLPEASAEKELTEGEMTLLVDGRKVTSKDMTVKESDLIIEDEE